MAIVPKLTIHSDAATRGENKVLSRYEESEDTGLDSVCQHGHIIRGDFDSFIVTGDTDPTSALAWNMGEQDLKTCLQSSATRVVEVDRLVYGKYGEVEWLVRFTENENQHPSGTGDINAIVPVMNTGLGTNAQVDVYETQKGSDGLSGEFEVGRGAHCVCRGKEQSFEGGQRLGSKFDKIEKY